MLSLGAPSISVFVSLLRPLWDAHCSSQQFSLTLYLLCEVTSIQGQLPIGTTLHPSVELRLVWSTQAAAALSLPLLTLAVRGTAHPGGSQLCILVFVSLFFSP